MTNKFLQRIRSAGDYDLDHRETMEETGHWGRQAAGAIIVAQDTGKLLFSLRSSKVTEPGTWAAFGGAIDGNEKPHETVKREVQEETQYTGPLHLYPLLVFKTDKFRYFNHLGIVPEQFTPALDHENDGYTWCEHNDLPSPLHPGIVTLFKHEPSIQIMSRILKRILYG